MDVLLALLGCSSSNYKLTRRASGSIIPFPMATLKKEITDVSRGFIPDSLIPVTSTNCVPGTSSVRYHYLRTSKVLSTRFLRGGGARPSLQGQGSRGQQT